MSAAYSNPHEVSRPPSQPSDQLVLHVEHVPLAGRLLAIEIFEVKNAASTKALSTPSSSIRPPSQPFVATPPLNTRRTAGFRVAARDEVENEYSLFVTRQKAEYLYRAAYATEAAAAEVITLEAMANGILAHLNIIGNRQRDVGKLTCREPEPRFEKKTRVSPTITSPQKQRNPHIAAKRQDQRAVRVQKISMKAMEAAAKAIHRIHSDASTSEDSGTKIDRKSSEASILHRMAVADSKTIWNSELEANYGESEHSLPLVENKPAPIIQNDGESTKAQRQTSASTGSPVHRAIPERKMKHKGLEERRQKGRQQRILAAQTAQEAPFSLLNSFKAQDLYASVIEELELEAQGSSRRSSMATTKSGEKSVSQLRVSSAPRSSVVVGNAYALKNLEDADVSEPEQFLRRRTLDNTNRSVLKADGWNDGIPGMGIEITDERPTFEAPSNQLDILLSGARRVMMMNAIGSTLQRNSSNTNLATERERNKIAAIATALHSITLGESSSAPVLPSPIEGLVGDMSMKTTQISCEEALVSPVTLAQSTDTTVSSVKNSPRPRSKSIDTEASELLSMADRSISNVVDRSTENQVTVKPSDYDLTTPRTIEDTSISTSHSDANDMESSAPRPRSNSVGSANAVRLIPLPSTAKPPVQDFLPPSRPEEDISVNPTPRNEPVQEQEAPVLPPDPEIELYSPVELTNKNLKIETNEGSSCQSETNLLKVGDDVEENKGTPLPIVNTASAEVKKLGLYIRLPAAENLDTPPHTTRQSCWEEIIPPVSEVVPGVITKDFAINSTPMETPTLVSTPGNDVTSCEVLQESIDNASPVGLETIAKESPGVDNPIDVSQETVIEAKVSKEQNFADNMELVITKAISKVVVEGIGCVEEKQECVETRSVAQLQQLDVETKADDLLDSVQMEGIIGNPVIKDSNLDSLQVSVNAETSNGEISTSRSQKCEANSVCQSSDENFQETKDMLDASNTRTIGKDKRDQPSEFSKSVGKPKAPANDNILIFDVDAIHHAAKCTQSAFESENDNSHSLVEPRIYDAFIPKAEGTSKTQCVCLAPLSCSNHETGLQMLAVEEIQGDMKTPNDGDNLVVNHLSVTATAEGGDSALHNDIQHAVSKTSNEEAVIHDLDDINSCQLLSGAIVGIPEFKVSRRDDALASKEFTDSRHSSEQPKFASKDHDRGKNLEGDISHAIHDSARNELNQCIMENQKKLVDEKVNISDPQAVIQSISSNSTPREGNTYPATMVTPTQLDQNPIEPAEGKKKPITTSRRKSLSPSKKVIMSNTTSNTKLPPKVSATRKKSIVTKAAEAQVDIPPSPELKRRHTAEDVNKRDFLRATRRVSSFERSDVQPSASPSETKPSTNLRDEKALRSSQPSQSKSSKRHSARLSGTPHSVTNYHKKWGKWLAGRNFVDKVSCLQLEELVVQDPRNEENLLKLGLRYARWPGTSLPGILLLEHASLLHKNATGTRAYWFWLGSAHLEIFMCHRKYLPIARFHLSKSIRAFTSAFAYIESLVDPMLLLRYAIGLFWHKGDGNLEKTRDIFHELFSRFTSFCDKDRPNLLFLQFQVLHRLKLYVDAIECMNKILDLHEILPSMAMSTKIPPPSSSMDAMAHFRVYDAKDYRLMLMQCQQASGDYVSAAHTLASVLKLKNSQQENTLKDDEYFDLWCSLAEKCFHHEDYALAMEYYAIALNFAKQSQELAAIHYNLGLCFQSLGEDGKCVTEYKRARTSNRHVAPLVSLTELSVLHDDRFALQLQKPVAQLIDEVRVDLYGRAVKRLQRIFRHNRRDVNTNTKDSSSDSPIIKMPSLARRRKSVVSVRNPPVLVKIELFAEDADAIAEEESQQKDEVVDDNQTSRRDNSTLEVIECRHELFLAKKQAAMEEMTELLTNPQYRGEVASPSSSRLKVGSQMRSGILLPEKNRLDVRRIQSMEAFRQLGYVSSTMPWIEFWEKLLVLGSELFESRQALYGSIARIRGRLPMVTDEVAFCALAESVGNVHQAAEKLHDSLYERELTYVCAVIDVSKQLVLDFPLEPTQLDKPGHVSLPTISSPRVEGLPTRGSRSPVGGAMSPNRVLLPPYSTARPSSAYPPGPKAQHLKKHLRVNQMLNIHFQDHVQQQEAAIAIGEATGGIGYLQQRTEQLMVLQNFRQTNGVLLSSQLPFGSEKAIS